MSLPHVRTTTPSATFDENEFFDTIDRPLIALTNVCGGDLRKLLYAFFSFLHRRTDFYILLEQQQQQPQQDNINDGGISTNSSNSHRSMGFKEGDAEKLLLAAFRQFPLRKIPTRPSPRQQQQQDNAATDTGTAASTKNTNDEIVDKSKNNVSKPIEISTEASTPTKTINEGNLDYEQKPEAKVVCTTNENNTHVSKNSKPDTTISAVADSDERTKGKSIVRYTADGLQIPVDNGGSTSRYVWTQTLEECTVYIPVTPPNIRGRDLNVSLSTTKLVVETKSPQQASTTSTSDSGCSDATTPNIVEFVNGTLYASIVPSESSWTIENGIVTVFLYKKIKTFWKTILVGDDEIDPTLVDSRRHIDTYDSATQAQIRKIIFDENQKYNNKPTSDELLLESIPPIPPELLSSSFDITTTTTKSSAPQPNNTVTSLPSGVEYISQATIASSNRASSVSSKQNEKVQTK